MKKLLTTLLAIILVFSLAACNNSDKKSDDKNNTSVNDTKDTTTEDNNDKHTDTDDSKNEYESDSISDATPLQDLYVIEEDAYFYENEITDAYGNTYAGPYYDFCSYGSSNKKDEYISQNYMIFKTGGEYQYLTGTFFTRSKQNEDHTIELLIYADDTLVFCSEPISRKDGAIELAVDIHNCDQLKITSRSYDYTSSNTNPGIILTNAQVCNGYISSLTEGVYVDPDQVPLTDMHVYGDHSTVLDNIHAGAVEDAYGNIYKGMYLELCSYGNRSNTDYDTQAYTEFVVNNQYTSLSGTFFTRNNQSENYTIELLIYADDELVYSSDMISRADGVLDFNVDISNCDIVKVMSRSLNYTSTGTNPGIIVMNPMLSY